MILKKKRECKSMVSWKLRSKIYDLTYVCLAQRAIARSSSSTIPTMSMQDSGGDTRANTHNCGQHRISQLRDAFSSIDPSRGWIVQLKALMMLSRHDCWDLFCWLVLGS
ncbi:hypothetical protein NW761_011813 [Fusarium oxysporum]|nr:hypothetical protein NW758_014483 [Fusarium oxysporum]KAJ4037607.1 hypothetical protein NW753_011514 [Fusarium oxysporum]KAJ4048363.1 hypothetical protein NW763_009775 [Fusarium oxysporum]KAJ4077442.1 hypothetical protein NW756_012304 [Fusarium oxysporum]KAJ4078302.1 hypothetical protein NW761_011813 [Fusarium oxysporum]